MGRAYNVIDADGHVLEPLNLWENYIDPAFRDRAPRLFIDADGKERLRIDGRTFGGRRGLGTLGAIGARDGVVCDDTMTYKRAARAASIPTHASPTWMPTASTQPSFIRASGCLSEGSRIRR